MTPSVSAPGDTNLNDATVYIKVIIITYVTLLLFRILKRP